MYFGLYATEITNKDSDNYPNSYPDVTISCHFNKPIDYSLKNEVYACVEKYVSMWNSDIKNSDKIHDFFFVDNTSDKVISIFVDFGNCEPKVLEKLLEYLSKSDLKIKELTLQ